MNTQLGVYSPQFTTDLQYHRKVKKDTHPKNRNYFNFDLYVDGIHPCRTLAYQINNFLYIFQDSFYGRVRFRRSNSYILVVLLSEVACAKPDVNPYKLNGQIRQLNTQLGVYSPQFTTDLQYIVQGDQAW
jgi:hypothetical protein